MEIVKQKKAAFQSSVELLVNQWKELDCHFKVPLGDEDEQNPKGLNLGGSAVKVENQDSFYSKMSELNDKKNEFLMKLRELDLAERINQKELQEKEKILEQKSLELDSQERAFANRGMKLHSELERIENRDAEIHLGKKKLENLKEGFEIKKMMFDLEPEKRRRAASGCARNVQTRDGLSFLLNIGKSHIRSYMTVPGQFFSAYHGLSAKKYVILSTDKGDFRLEVRHYSSPQSSVQFFQGWKDFYTKNLLEVGCQCLFRLKENTVNGDASGFSMDVSVLYR